MQHLITSHRIKVKDHKIFLYKKIDFAVRWYEFTELIFEVLFSFIAIGFLRIFAFRYDKIGLFVILPIWFILYAGYRIFYNLLTLSLIAFRLYHPMIIISVNDVEMRDINGKVYKKKVENIRAVKGSLRKLPGFNRMEYKCVMDLIINTHQGENIVIDTIKVWTYNDSDGNILNRKISRKTALVGEFIAKELHVPYLKEKLVEN